MVLLGMLTGRPALAVATDLSNTPDPTWMTDGPVYALTHIGNTVYLGGRFSQVRQKPLKQGGPFVNVDDLAGVDATTGAPVEPTWDPSFNLTGTVYALAPSPDGSMIYVGGDFTATVGDVTLKNIAAVNAITGAVDPNFHPKMGSLVHAILTSASKVYVGGDFLRVNSRPNRTRLAAFDYSGNLDPNWTPTADGPVRALAFSSDGTSIFVAGNFANVSALPRQSLANVDPATGAVQPWVAGHIDPQEVGFAMVPTPAVLYVGMGGPNNYVAAYDTTTGQQLWRDHASGNVQAIALLGGNELIVGGHFLVMNQGHDPQDYPRIRLAGVFLDGTIDQAWQPSVTGNFFGPWVVMSNGNQLYVGGQFSTVSGVHQKFFARFTS